METYTNPIASFMPLEDEAAGVSARQLRLNYPKEG
jgi:hypothetical protein